MKALLALGLLLFLAGCGDESMDNQNRLKTYASARGLNYWPLPGEALPLVKGTVAQADLARDRDLATPPPVTLALVQRGQERYAIFCAACHGLAGDGDGIVVARGFPRPVPFSDPKLVAASARHLVDVIGGGSGKMYGFSDRIAPRDRWAIAAYIRALQLAGLNGAGR
jgi:mono/diheme cytochrome c family protein